MITPIKEPLRMIFVIVPVVKLPTAAQGIDCFVNLSKARGCIGGPDRIKVVFPGLVSGVRASQHIYIEHGYNGVQAY
jgi:hypothetical protein